jgi:amino acid transporter
VGPSGSESSGGQYRQQLHRTIGVLGNIAMTVSGVAPTASIFIIAPVAYANQGSGTFLAFIIAAIIGIGMACAYGELGSTFPVFGGDYALVARAMGKPAGWIAFGVGMIVTAVFIPSAIALGAGQYVDVLVPRVNPNLVGVAIIVVATLLGVLHIRFNAVITGFFLAIELLAVAIVTVLGLTHVNQPLSILWNPQTFAAGGASSPVPLGVIMAGVAIGIFSYNGYGTAVVFSEEMSGRRRNVAHAVLWSFVITVAAELIPVTAALLGAPSVSDLSAAPSPMSYVIAALAGDTVNKFVSLIVVLAIFNGTLAILLEFGRIVASSARDRAWPDFVSRWLGAIHPRYKSPWIATLLVGVVGAVLTGLSNVAALVTFTGVTLCLVYFLVAASSIVSRITKPDLARP